MTKAPSPSLAALLATASLLAGCGTLEPPYRRPEASIPPTFPQGAPPYLAAQPAATPASQIAWRSVYGDPKLQALIQTGLNQNRDLRATIANVEAAHAQFEAQRSQLLPTVAVSGAATYAREPGLTGGRVEAQSFGAGVGVAAYELDLFGRLRSLSKAAFEQYLATDEGRRAAQLALVAEIADAYLTLAGDRSLLQVSQTNQASAQESLDLTQRRFDAGVASQLDVDQAATVVQQARANAAAYAVAAAQAKNALDRLVGSVVPEDRTPTGLEETMASFADVPAGLSSDILLSRPDVLQAEHQLRAANADIGAARAAFFPSITLTGQAGALSPNLAGLFKGSNSVWSFAPAINLPIFTGGRNRANLRYSQAVRDAAVANYQGAIQTAFRETADALAQRGGSIEQLAAQRALVRAAADALTLSTARYERGADTYLNTLLAQRTLYAAQLDLVSIELVRTANLVTLYRALGGGLS
jgi:multidrug efflux system outer membrane protein